MGAIFDIKQLSVFDGPGIRTTVFFKGCPLRCQWCHNPEGLRIEPQLMVSANGCTHCGKCEAACPTPGRCTGCGQCALVCPMGLRRVCGTEHDPEALAKILLKDADYLKANGGGYTISGGEPTMQPEFLIALLQRLCGNHRAIETCGHCATDVWQRVLNNVELVLLDIKHADPAAHRRYTGAGNERILSNLQLLKASGKPFIARMPVIPGVNDDAANYAATAALLRDAPSLIRVELLPYHATAGAKYSMVGMDYQPGFDPTQPPHLNASAFEAAGIPCAIL